MHKNLLIIAAIALLGASAVAVAQKQSTRANVPDAVIDAAIASAWSTAKPDWQARAIQDETQKACTTYNNAPPKDVADAIVKRELATIQYPPDGQFLGDWKKGEALAQSGYGLRFTDADTSRPNGGNCYACHQLDVKELSYGTLGPPLNGYGKDRKFANADAKTVYERIYNPQAALPCANMPRFGTNKVLTIEQIKDLVALVMSKDSPVNQ